MYSYPRVRNIRKMRSKYGCIKGKKYDFHKRGGGYTFYVVCRLLGRRKRFISTFLPVVLNQVTAYSFKKKLKNYVNCYIPVWT